jgi:predicted O-methyltransferase YrrM
MKKINYLINTKSNFALIKSYLLNSFKIKFLKKKKKEFNAKHKMFLSDKKVTRDYFSLNAFDWINTLNEFKNKKFKFLEIGSFEGNSTLFILENFKGVDLTCVDQWKQLYREDGKREGYEDLSINEIEKNFDTNLKDYSGRFLKNKISSNNFFRNNNQEFDVIYIDGSHYAPDVLEDCKNSWSVLKKNGILILDDYFWKGYAKIEENPAFAINQFLKEANNKYEVANFSKYQLFLRKLN